MIRRFAFFLLPVLGIVAIGSYAIFEVLTKLNIVSGGTPAQIVGVFFVAMPIILIITMFIGFSHNNKIITCLYIPSALWLGILLYLLMYSVIISLSNILFVSIGVEKYLPVLSHTLLIGIVILIIYGIINASNPRVKKFTIKSNALRNLWSDKKIILFSDAHLGIVRGAKFMKKVVELINKQNPDIVFIAGDIIDGPVFDYEKGLTSLRDLKPGLGIYYTPGNHEEYNSQPEKFYPIIKSVTNTLIDEKLIVNGTQIIGLDYKTETGAETRERLYKSGYDKNLPSITLLHDPKHTKVLADENVSLILSGHTHSGQFFPISLIVKSIYGKLAYGVNNFGNSNSITTCGVGTAMTPIRIGTNPEIVVIEII